MRGLAVHAFFAACFAFAAAPLGTAQQELRGILDPQPHAPPNDGTPRFKPLPTVHTTFEDSLHPKGIRPHPAQATVRFPTKDMLPNPEMRYLTPVLLYTGYPIQWLRNCIVQRRLLQILKVNILLAGCCICPQ